MPRFERCTKSSGTSSKVYDLFKICHNALRSVLLGTVTTLKFLSENVFILLPGKSLALPICINGVFSIPTMPDAKVWAVKTEIYNPFTFEYMTISTEPLFKDSLEDIWREVVEPLDAPVSGSEFFFYEKADGTIAQGVNWYGVGDHKYFYILADGGPLVRDTTLIIMFIYVLNALGLVHLIAEFIKSVLMSIKNGVMRRQIQSIGANVDTMLSQMLTIVNSVTDGDRTVLSIAGNIQDKIGVRLLLH